MLTGVSKEPRLFIYFHEKVTAKKFVRIREFQLFMSPSPGERGNSVYTGVFNNVHQKSPEKRSQILLQINGRNRIGLTPF